MSKQQALPLEQAESARALDPNVLQRQASNPGSSIWVSASAGTGKTKVLTDRVLRLLLPRSKEQAGTPPHKILCLTFTKAGANEMALRINKVLGLWAVMKEDVLKDALKDLLGRTAHDYEIAAARKLFATVVDIPGGLKIMTIHSFCQSVLGRFPLEAGLSPGSVPLEEAQKNVLLDQARKTIFYSNETSICEALERLTAHNNEEQFTQILTQLMSERYRLGKLLENRGGIAGFYKTLCTSIGVQPDETPETILQKACGDNAFDVETLRQACRALIDAGSASDVKNGERIAAFLSTDPQNRPSQFDDYAGVFLTDKNAIRARLATKAVVTNMPDILNIMTREAGRILVVKERLNTALCAQLTSDAVFLGYEILKQYQRLKTERGVLDFDDLITYTLSLLGQKNGTSWVMYKLDQGLDHILVDEAQDTNPEQWQIVQLLAEEFFSGQSTREDITRTLFVVGDEKQSIYSFQRAAPEEFERMKVMFREKIESVGAKFDPVALNISFRTVKSVLSAVDAVFAALSTDHQSYRTLTNGHGGHVEVWPLFENEDPPETDFWAPPVKAEENKSAAGECAEFIAEQIAGWIERGDTLESSGEPITAGDIMVLVRSRTAFVTQLTRALKQKKVAVSGTDRMVLSSQLPVQDVLALCHFALLPDDDLTLACILKSPFIGWNEDRLYHLAVDRTASLWQALKTDDSAQDIRTYLENLIHQAGTLSPYSFLATILQTPCPMHDYSGQQALIQRLGTDCMDPLDEFLNHALAFERQDTTSLQGFVQSFAASESEIKREMEEAGNAVRIMTVHGAKGLQAPIVILPDTVLNGNARRPDRLIWPLSNDKPDGLPLPLYAPNAAHSCETYKQALEDTKTRSDAEYQRLLYVAMTRAEDRLYVTGYRGKTNPLPQSWYFQVEAGLEALKNESGYGVTQEGYVRFDNPQIRKVAKKAEAKPTPSATPEIAMPPDWLFEPAPGESKPLKPLIPSRPSGQNKEGNSFETPATSPLARDDLYRFKRGNLTHKLLQFLPDLPVENREEATREFAEKQEHDLRTEIREDILKETMAILNHPEFAPLFGKGSIAEAPISGLLPDGRVISGQIDRLLITDHMVYIVDYKTNRPHPREEKDIPQIYLNQMQAYYDVLKEIYPDKDIKCALLWTDGPRLMELNLAIHTQNRP